MKTENSIVIRTFVPARIQNLVKALLFRENDCWIIDQLIVNTQFPHMFLYMVSFFQVEEVFGTFYTIFMPTGSRTNCYLSGFLFIKGFYLFTNCNQHIQVVLARIIFKYLFSRCISSFSN